ncbi:7TM diverse intracellular signaling domain-containing protein [Pedobacter caeni]|uniref:histidine kinase n=1 Tax=Pedobacter caeni TaxID=288992 RepID=A0A1M5F1V6_9SPHI|nr:7TM diverse intracellular signaling domain-containing protein [Pedobacter caeni]SHF85514.1 Signal transduction histidine kinase [Pedobacter caeni]
MLRNLLIYVLLLFMAPAAMAQLEITSDGRQIDYRGAEIQYAFSSSNDFSDSALFKMKKGDWKTLLTGKIPISNSPHCVWLKIPVRSVLTYGDFNFIDINNPHINFLRCWIIRKDSLIKAFPRSGDNVPFSNRPLPTASFIYHINGSDYLDCDFVIATDKRYTKLDLPVNFYTETYYLRSSQSKNLLFGLFLGITLFLFVFNFYLFISIRQNLYLWYSIYILMIAFYLGTSMGHMFMYFYPDYPFLNDIIRPAVFALSFIPQVNFFNNLMNLQEKMPLMYRFNKRLLVVFAVLFVLAVATSASGNYKIQGYWVYANRIIYPLVLMVILAESIYCFKKGIRYAGYSVISLLIIFASTLIYVLQQNEILPRNGFTSSAVYWGLFFEGMVMAFALAWRFKSYKEDSERLLKETQLQQENIFNETATYQQKEMQRMSSLLHDTVGANLGFLRLETDNMPLTEEGRAKIAGAITKLGQEVRTMSHEFSPLVLQDKGLYLSIAEMVKLIINNGKIDLQFEWLGVKDRISVQYEIIIYRMVQEILQNLLKHSKATAGFLQVMVEQDLVSIYAEDNGVGLDPNKISDGVGLKSLEDLVKLLKGSFSIDSSEDKGFSISIEFNQHQHENI